MIDENPLYALLIYGFGLFCVLAHIFVNAVMLKDQKAMNKIAAKNGVKTIMSSDDISLRGKALIAANFIGACIIYGSVISVMIFQPLEQFGLYQEPYLVYTVGFIFYIAFMAFVLAPNSKKDNDAKL